MMNIDELTSYVLLSGGTAKEIQIRREDEHNLAAPTVASMGLSGHYYKLTLLTKNKKQMANILYYRDDERLCAVGCRLSITTELDTQILPGIGYDEVVSLFAGEDVEFT